MVSRIYDVKSEAETERVVDLLDKTISRETVKISVSEVCENPGYLRALYTNLGLVFLAKINGILAFIILANSFFTQMYEKVGGKMIDPRLATFLMQGSTAIGKGLSIGFVKVFGRKTLFMNGMALNAICFLFCAFFYATE